MHASNKKGSLLLQVPFSFVGFCRKNSCCHLDVTLTWSARSAFESIRFTICRLWPLSSLPRRFNDLVDTSTPQTQKSNPWQPLPVHHLSTHGKTALFFVFSGPMDISTPPTQKSNLGAIIACSSPVRREPRPNLTVFGESCVKREGGGLVSNRQNFFGSPSGRSGDGAPLVRRSQP